MKERLLPIAVAILAAFSARSQITITSADMFNEAGLYDLAYANNYEPRSPTTSYPVANIMGSAGPSRFWNFISGPTNKVWRFDYLNSAGRPEAAAFPQAKIAERKTVVDSNQLSWLMFEQVPNLGRKVYGFYDEDFSSDTPSNVFNPPIIDFPKQINYGDTWNTSTTIATSIALLDPEIFDSIPTQVTFISNFKVDAWGIVDLPGLGLLDALRVNEEQSIAVAVDLDGEGQFQNIETDYARTYYWLSPGHGIVAQLASVQSTTPPDNNFPLATAFVRMFETNKKLSAGCTDPGPVTDLKIKISNGKVLLQWTKTLCAKQYRVEYSNNPSDNRSWKTLGDLTPDEFMLDTTGSQDRMRFYRVVSLKQ